MNKNEEMKGGGREKRVGGKGGREGRMDKSTERQKNGRMKGQNDRSF